MSHHRILRVKYMYLTKAGQLIEYMNVNCDILSKCGLLIGYQLSKGYECLVFLLLQSDPSLLCV